MKKKIAILGSTGSIGKCLIDIIKKDKKNFEIILLSADENYKELLKQAKFFNVKNLIITNNKSFNAINKSKYSKKINVYNNFDNFKKIFKKKIDYTMSSISGVQGLKPTIEIIRYTNKIAIANKEAIICGWDLIEKNLKKHKTQFIPVDSEHFYIWSLLNNSKNLDTKMSPKQIFDISTNQNFQKLNLNSDMSPMEVGSYADFISIDLSNEKMQPLHDLVNNVVLSASAREVNDVIIDAGGDTNASDFVVALLAEHE